MRPLWLTVVTAAGRTRSVLVVTTSAVMSGLLLVAVSMARLRGYVGEERLLGPVADPGTRPGSVLAVVLVAVPIALLLDQSIRLGSAAQRRRYQALAVAGATTRDLRWWGAVELGGPALAGAVLGVPVWLLLRVAMGTMLVAHQHSALVPTTTGPGIWALVVVAAVTSYGVLVGGRAAVRATVAVARDRRPPRPWGLALLAAAAALLGRAMTGDDGSDTSALAATVLAVLGFMVTTPWLAYVLSGLVTTRARSAALLLASRRIRADHGAAGRAAAAVGAVGLTLGVLGVFVGDLFVTGADLGDRDYYLLPAVLVGVLALLALGVITLSLSLHSIETTLERRREMSALVATGVPLRVLEAATRAECRLVTLPLTVVAALVGAGVYVWGPASGPGEALGGLVAVVAAALAVLLAVRLAALVARPWLRAAVSADNLRTE